MIIDESTQLEPTDEKHAEPAFALIDQNRAHLKTWLPWVDRMQSVADFRNFIRGSIQRNADKAEVSYLIVHEGKVAGRIGLYYLDHQNKSASIGYWLGENYQGKGLITNSCRVLLNHGFHALGLNRIEIKCGTGNVKSQAIPQRLNFTKEGVLRQAELVHGSFIDLDLYSLLKEEWEGSSKN
jgi:ribosomal-protein-serine acetyltransferase